MGWCVQNCLGYLVLLVSIGGDFEDIARKHLLWFQSKGITTVVVACNTLCSTVIPKLKEEFVDMEIVDIISLTCNALKDECISSLLLLATKRSIESKVYEENIQAMFPNCTIYPVVPSLWCLVLKIKWMKLL